MTGLQTEPLVEALGLNARVMGKQFDEFAASRLRLGNRPNYHLLSNAPAATMRGDANVLDQATRGALRAEARQDAQFQAAHDGTVNVLGDHELDARVAVDGLERFEIACGQ